MTTLLADRIKTASLTKTQKKIADYFLKNQDRIAALSSLEVAGELGISDASVIRFSRAIGFDGFADLKDQVYRALVENAHQGVSLSERMSRNREKYSDSDKTLSFRKLMQQNMESVFLNNRQEDFVRVADTLVGAERKYVLGLRGCRGVALQFGRLLAFMLPGVHTLTDAECTSVSSIQDAGPEDVLLMFVYSRTYHIDVSLLKMASQRGARIVLVTNDITSPLCQYAEVILMTETSNLSFFHSTIGADLIGEYLLNLVSDRVQFEERIRERDEITKSQRLE
ncbi:MAG: MurR/RpiR family transcriptional regulator [Lachnospiraceae bacterium]|nr:MurR/RpiR family transcriptional regulator [Lachnospiraceae bacterium]